MKWSGEHPSKTHLAVIKLKNERARIPKINYMDFVDTKDFEEENLIFTEIPEEKRSRHIMMEKYCSKACVMLVPFRNVQDDLKKDGSFQKKISQWSREGRLTEYHEQLLENLQNCRNSLNAGRPQDWLEKFTEVPKAQETNNDSVDMDNEDDEEMLGAILGSLVENTVAFESF